MEAQCIALAPVQWSKARSQTYESLSTANIWDSSRSVVPNVLSPLHGCPASTTHCFHLHQLFPSEYWVAEIGAWGDISNHKSEMPVLPCFLQCFKKGAPVSRIPSSRRFVTVIRLLMIFLYPRNPSRRNYSTACPQCSEALSTTWQCSDPHTADLLQEWILGYSLLV